MPKQAGSSLVYFVEAVGLERIKIGFTEAGLQRRLAALADCSPAPLVVLGVMPGGRDLERELHARFRAHRAHGEWFHASLELRAFIDARTQCPAGKPKGYADWESGFMVYPPDMRKVGDVPTFRDSDVGTCRQCGAEHWYEAVRTRYCGKLLPTGERCQGVFVRGVISR